MDLDDGLTRVPGTFQVDSATAHHDRFQPPEKELMVLPEGDAVNRRSAGLSKQDQSRENRVARAGGGPASVDLSLCSS